MLTDQRFLSLSLVFTVQEKGYLLFIIAIILKVYLCAIRNDEQQFALSRWLCQK